MEDNPPANKQAFKAFPGIHTLRVEKFHDLCIVTGSDESYSVKTGWQFGCMVSHKDIPRSRFLAGTLVAAQMKRGWFVLCWGPVDGSEKEQRCSLLRLNRLQPIKEKHTPCPPGNSAELFMKECWRLQQLYNFSPTEEGQRPVNNLLNPTQFVFSIAHTNYMKFRKGDCVFLAGTTIQCRGAKGSKPEPVRIHVGARRRPLREGGFKEEEGSPFKQNKFTPDARAPPPRCTESRSVQEIHRDDEHTSPAAVVVPRRPRDRAPWGVPRTLQLDDPVPARNFLAEALQTELEPPSLLRARTPRGAPRPWTSETQPATPDNPTPESAPESVVQDSTPQQHGLAIPTNNLNLTPNSAAQQPPRAPSPLATLPLASDDGVSQVVAQLQQSQQELLERQAAAHQEEMRQQQAWFQQQLVTLQSQTVHAPGPVQEPSVTSHQVLPLGGGVPNIVPPATIAGGSVNSGPALSSYPLTNPGFSGAPTPSVTTQYPYPAGSQSYQRMLMPPPAYPTQLPVRSPYPTGGDYVSPREIAMQNELLRQNETAYRERMQAIEDRELELARARATERFKQEQRRWGGF
ncbi:hypothetical protein CYMTET_49044 [Cymbomonas tetramitiformis]|uniref:Uncharacterized protein n=1 Tax=Cymbomonas tetramitiformis TaxID=36881 RepID=A0AAE0BR03_9CHLO|nr:hypothetical protein CYMTET_49044 [Cymbomonas tetramitiformis]